MALILPSTSKKSRCAESGRKGHRSLRLKCRGGLHVLIALCEIPSKPRLGRTGHPARRFRLPQGATTDPVTGSLQVRASSTRSRAPEPAHVNNEQRESPTLIMHLNHMKILHLEAITTWLSASATRCVISLPLGSKSAQLPVTGS